MSTIELKFKYEECDTPFYLGMNILIKRFAKKNNYTIGRMYLNNEYFCDTLEDKDRGLTQDLSRSVILKIKIPNETAIPLGIYKVALIKSPKFGRVLPRLLDVPGFEGILIHRGNTNKDTSGCILVGENKAVGKVLNSTYYENKIVEVLSKVIAKGEFVTIEII